MGKKRKHLSHEEVWDDSALVDSWDAALEEYQHYHSIHARGERVEDVLEKAERSGETAVSEEATVGPASSNFSSGLPHSEDLEDGEVEDGQVDDEMVAAAGMENGSAHVEEELLVEQQQSMPATTGSEATRNAPASHGIPDVLMNGVQDEGLKNLMMSWYYAGYYTGLYEGRQQAHSTAVDGVENGRMNT
ncbi:MAG: hypothetical protein LQ338_006635 [Usnochroma carphineum]|nr:MAG: hypothetical protein LQ338_006635 [Usnochroma carphineum]